MTTQPILHPALFKFLDAIREENSRKYFASIRPLYDDIWFNLQTFFDEMIQELAKNEPDLAEVESKKCLFRIYRDARRLKDGDPIYKNNRGAHITPFGKNSTKAGYYVHFQSGGSFFGGGLYWPTSEQLLKIRNFLTKNGARYYDIVQDRQFKSRFGDVHGGALSKLPRGFEKDTPYPELLMKKQHIIMHTYSDEEILAPNFLDVLLADCRIAKPFFDFLNESL